VKKRSVSDAKVVRDFERFVASGYKKSLFTKDLYHELSMCFGFIAHFDRDGFYEARFVEPVERAETLTVMTDPTAWTERPLETALRQVVTNRGLLDAAVRELAVAVEGRERAELARLKVKYEGA